MFRKWGFKTGLWPFLKYEECSTLTKSPKHIIHIPGARTLEIMWTTTKFPQTNAEDSISSNSCGLHWIIDPLQTMIVIACWISCYPDSIAVDLPPEFLTVGQSCRMLDSRSSSPTMMSASWRSLFPSTWPWFRKNLWGMCCAWTWVKYRKPWLLRIRKKNKNRRSYWNKQTVQKIFSIVPCPLIIIIGSRWSLHHTFWFTHFSIRLGLDSSDWMVVPQQNRPKPPAQ